MINRFRIVKNILILLSFFIFLLQSCTYSIDRITIQGFFSSSPKTFIYLNKFDGEQLTFIDSVKTNSEGNFSIKIDVETLNFITLGNRQNSTPIILLVQPGENLIIKSKRSDLLDYKVIGSNESTLIQGLTVRLNKTKSQIDSLKTIYNASLGNQKLDSIKYSLDSTYRSFIERHRSFTCAFIKNNPFSPASILALFQTYDVNHPVLDYSKDRKLFRMVDSSLVTVYPTSGIVMGYRKKIHKLDSLYQLSSKRDRMFKVGEILPDIGYPLITGDDLFISSIWFRYILVDFWADWCDTCSVNNKNLREIYKEFGPKGLIVLQVSLGSNPDSLKLQSSRDSMLWYHAAIQNYFSSKILDTLRISSVPSNYITDRRGTIKAVNLYDVQLKEKMKELFP
jgi:peroxiredoxin